MKQILSIIVIIVPALCFGIIGKTAEMGLMIVASSIAIAFFNIDKVQKFKGAGFEAEMKKNVEKAIEEAYVTIDNLKEIATPLSVATVELLNYHNRLSGIPIEKTHEIKNGIEEIVNKLKIKDNEKIKLSIENFYKSNTWDFFNEFLNEFFRGKNNYDEQNKIKDALFLRNTANYPSKENILKAINVKEEDLNEIQKKKMDNYIYYKKHKKLP